jgi:FkbM family methyltransferase
MKILIKFRHGLGDAVQLTSVLSHLKTKRPEWQVDVASLIGKHSAHRGLCNRVYRLGIDPIPEHGYQRIFNLDWHECDQSFADSPSTKVEFCLRSIFDIQPNLSLLKYRILIREQAARHAEQYLQTISGTPNKEGKFSVAVIHYQGNTSAGRKNLSHELTAQLCNDLITLGLTPLILDWDRRSPLPDNRAIFCPDVEHPLWSATGTGDAEMIGALISKAVLMVGIDSGPQKVAAALETPTIAVWTGNHPIHYCCPADNVLHLVPSSHAELIRGERESGLSYFTRHYRFDTYIDLQVKLLTAVSELLQQEPNELTWRSGFWIRQDNAAQDMVIVNDVFNRDSYRVNEIPLPAEVVIDVGAHIGTFALRWHRRNPNARIICVEACPENIIALKANAGTFADVVHAACTYEQDVVLLNAVTPQCRSTGGSRLVSAEEAKSVTDTQYWTDHRPLPTVTLDELVDQRGLKQIDVLKLDCEGSEFSILENAKCLDQVRLVVGEFHGRERFMELIQRRFQNWHLRILCDGDPGTFWLRNPS